MTNEQLEQTFRLMRASQREYEYPYFRVNRDVPLVSTPPKSWCCVTVDKSRNYFPRHWCVLKHCSQFSILCCTVQVVVKWLGLSLACAEYGPRCKGLCTRLCGRASAEAVGGGAGGGVGWLLLVCMHAPLLPGPIFNSFISGRVQGIISADAVSIKSPYRQS